VASIGDMGSLPLKSAAYGASKAAVNYIVRKIHFENPGLIAFPMSPGWVQTDMGNYGATSHGLESAPVTIDESIGGMVKKVCLTLGSLGSFCSFLQDTVCVRVWTTCSSKTACSGIW
jgi:NAD(P)-dependent dehydrogenase (short-subunit alcohol dehydrogenase family)